MFCSPLVSSAALGRVPSGVAGGYINPKTAVTLSLLAQPLNQFIELAQDESANAPGGNARHGRVVFCLVLPAPPEPPSQVAPTPQSEHSPPPEPNPQAPPQPVPP